MAKQAEYKSQKERKTIAISIRAWEPFNQFCTENNIGKIETIDELIIRGLENKEVRSSLLTNLTKRGELAEKLESLSSEQLDKLLSMVE